MRTGSADLRSASILSMVGCQSLALLRENFFSLSNVSSAEP
jgi:hypothetical protein